jgi:TrmH family RNA methyltransferase
VTRLRRLVSKRGVRDAEQVFVAEGIKVVEAALHSGAAIEAIYVDSVAGLSEAASMLLDEAESLGIRIFGLAPGVMDRVADAVTPQPILAVVHFVDRNIATIDTGTIFVLVDVRDPGNIGTIIRSADAAGIDALIACDGCGDIYGPKVVRSSAGSLFHLPLVRGGAPLEVLGSLRDKGFTTIATVASDASDYADIELSQPLAMVFGNESQGLSAQLVAMCASSIMIPIAGGAESLNVAMAATVFSFELNRRRRQRGPQSA